MSEKKQMLFNYITGNEFRQNLEAVIEAFNEMKVDIDSERRAMEKSWKKREKQAQKAVLGLASVVGDLQGIVGASSLPELKNLDMPSLPEEKKNLSKPK